jgi:pimeloyl-ACP methyl ester carboxylesterase
MGSGKCGKKHRYRHCTTFVDQSPNPALVLLHGAFGFAEGWGAVLPALAKTRRVIIVELQGHGHTADRDQPLTYEQMADDTAELLKQLKIGSADFFGYSMGGTVAPRSCGPPPGTCAQSSHSWFDR